MSAVTSRYARAFVDVVLEHHLDAAKIVGELRTLALIAQSSLELRRVWENPSIPSEQKRGLLDAIVARQALSRPVRNFIAVLIDHSRINVLDQVIKENPGTPWEVLAKRQKLTALGLEWQPTR